MPEGTDGGQGRPSRGKPPDFDLLRHNLGMAEALEEYLGTAYGPGGRAKLVSDDQGRPVPTLNGARMLRALDSDHPVLRVLRRAAAAQEEEWADGTKAATLLGLRLLRRAEHLLDQGLHPHHVLGGYQRGLDLAREAADAHGRPVDPSDAEVLVEVGRGALGTAVPGRVRAELAQAAARAARQVARPTDAGWRCDRRDVHVFALPGPGFSVELVRGYVLKRFPDDPRMPKRVRDARIALLDAAPIRGKAGIHEPRLRWVGESKIFLRRPSEIEEYEDWAGDYTRDLVEGVRAAGASVVLCRLGISDLGHKLLADAGIMGIRRIMKTVHMEAVARATGAALIKDFREVRPEDLGRAGLVEERSYGGEKYLVLTDCANPRVTSLVVRAPGETLAEQYREQAEKAVGAVAAALEDPRLAVGGGALEMAASGAVRQAAGGVAGREQLATEAFGRALEDLVALLAGNLGANPLDAVLDLRSRHAAGDPSGLRPGPRTPDPPREPLAPRLNAWGRAVEVCRSILRVDDVHRAAGTFTDPEKEREKRERQKDLPEEREEPSL